MDRLEKVLRDECNCQFMCVSEHWRTKEEINSVGLRGFQLASSFCRKRGAHGGSAIYIKEGITWKTRKHLEKMSVYGQIEISAVECSLDGDSPVIVISIYRPSGSNVEVFFERLESLLSNIIQEWKTIIIAGDFNMEMKQDNKLKDQLFSLTSSFGLHPRIEDCTRKESCLDNILTNIENSKGSVFEAHISDHNMQKLTFKIKEPTKQETHRYGRIYSEEAKFNFRTQLKQQDWQQVCAVKMSEVDEQWSCFIRTFTDIFNSCFPLKLIGFRKQNLYFNDQSIVECKNRLDILLISCRTNPMYTPLYNSAKKEYDKLLSDLKRKRYDERIKASDNKNKTMWSTVKDIKGNSACSRDCKFPGNIHEVSNQYNNYLVNIIPDLLGSIPDLQFECNTIVNNPNSMFLAPTTPEEVADIAKTLSNKLSCGQDEIPVTIVKLCIPDIKDIISYIINNSFHFGIFPRHLKLAIIKPLYKKGNPELKESYRPISLLNSFSKIFEFALSMRLVNFLPNVKYSLTFSMVI